VATISNLESKIDSTSFDAAVKQMGRMQQQVDERVSNIAKQVERKLDKEEIEKLEKKYFNHVSKVFQGIQKLADKEEVNKRFTMIDEAVKCLSTHHLFIIYRSRRCMSSLGPRPR
jgi:hypothetical protein